MDDAKEADAAASAERVSREIQAILADAASRDDIDFATASPEMLRQHAAKWDGEMHHGGADEYDWVFVGEAPLGIPQTKREWDRWWRSENREARKYGCDGMWDGLLDAPEEEPVLLTLRVGGRWGIPDGNHRYAAAVLAGRASIMAVIGVMKGATAEDLPKAFRSVPEIAALFGPEAPKPGR